MTDGERVGPVDHIARRVLPWRTAADLTECGKNVAELGGRVVTRADVEARVKRIGQRRAAFTTCMTCAGTSDRLVRYGQGDVVSAVAREAAAVEYANPPRVDPDVSNDRVVARRRSAHDLWARRQLLLAEFEAIAALVAAHRVEFDGYLAGLGETVSLTDRRAARRRRSS